MTTPVSYQTPFSAAVDDELFGHGIVGRYVQTHAGVFGPITGMSYTPPVDSLTETGYWSLAYVGPAGLATIKASEVVAVGRRPVTSGIGYLAGSGTSKVYRLTPETLTMIDAGLPLPEASLSSMAGFALERQAYFAGGYSTIAGVQTASSRISRVNGLSSVTVVATQTEQLSPVGYGHQASASRAGKAYLFGGLGSYSPPLTTDAGLVPTDDIVECRHVGAFSASRLGLQLSAGKFAVAAAKAVTSGPADNAPVFLAGGIRAGSGLTTQIEAFDGTVIAPTATSLSTAAWGMTGLSLPSGSGVAAYFVGGSTAAYSGTAVPVLDVRRLTGGLVFSTLASLPSGQRTVEMAAAVLDVAGPGTTKPVGYLASGASVGNAVKLTKLEEVGGSPVLTALALQLATPMAVTGLTGVGLPASL